MLRGIYTAASGMITQQRKHDTATNNMANLNTPGFKEAVPVVRSFPEALIALKNGDGRAEKTGIGSMHTGVMVEEILFPVLQGEIYETGLSSDFALLSDITVMREVAGEQVPIAFDASGKFIDENGQAFYQPQAFFTTQNEQGELRFTRNGKFTVDSEGVLRAMSGQQVMGTDEQPLSMGDRYFDQIAVNARGQLYDAATGDAILSAAGEPLAILISQIDNPNELIQEGNSAYRLENEAGSRPVDDLNEIRVSQGYIERSNVDPVQTMTSLMSAVRAYEANQRVIQSYDRIMEKSANEIGRV